jgi:hypothetical protein
MKNESIMTTDPVLGSGMHEIETGIQNNDKANWQIKVLARIQRDCPWYQGCTLTSEQNPKSHRKMVALELDTNDGHGTIKSEPAPRKRENWIENHKPIPNPNRLFDLAISNCKTIRAIYIYIHVEGPE